MHKQGTGTKMRDLLCVFAFWLVPFSPSLFSLFPCFTLSLCSFPKAAAPSQVAGEKGYKGLLSWLRVLAST